MNLAPLLQASPIIQLHVAAALLALLVGAMVLFRRKGDRPHKAMGRLWVGAMAVVALSSFFIWTIRLWGLFSPIHLLSLLTLVLLWRGIGQARRHNIRMHRRLMQATYLLGLVVTGLFTFYPGRLMYRTAFGPAGATPAKLAIFALLLTLAGLATVLVLRWRRAGSDKWALPQERTRLGSAALRRTIAGGLE